jgi:hypothetical protein
MFGSRHSDDSPARTDRQTYVDGAETRCCCSGGFGGQKFDGTVRIGETIDGISSKPKHRLVNSWRKIDLESKTL